MSVPEAPSQMENFNFTTSTSGRGALAVKSPSRLVMVDDSEPDGSLKPLPPWKRLLRTLMLAGVCGRVPSIGARTRGAGRPT
eukprot:988952-Pleurochrysis_carterae.AAC.1